MRYSPMEYLPRMLLFALGAMLIAGALFAANAAITGQGRAKPFVDKDADGEPDETPDQSYRGQTNHPVFTGPHDQPAPDEIHVDGLREEDFAADRLKRHQKIAA